MPLVNHSFRASFCSLLIHFLTGAYLSNVLSMRRRRVSNPKLMSLFSVAKVQLISLMSFEKFSSLKFLKLLQKIWELSSSVLVPNRLSKTMNWGKWWYRSSYVARNRVEYIVVDEDIINEGCHFFCCSNM